ncbi:MAG: response regulator [Ignavibacteriales bacterium]|nr:response regulator [Ignavibacteriales bacterium]
MEQSKINLKSLENFNRGLNGIFFTVKYFNGSNENFVSDSVQFVTGYSPSEIKKLPDNHHSLITSDDKSRINKELSEFYESKKLNTLDLIYKIKHKDGKEIWLKELINAERSTKSSTMLVAKSVIQNITDIKINESELQKSRDALKELNTTKDKFISIISHDLRAPFTTLLGFSEILLNEQDLTEDEKNEYLRYIYDASKSQLELINCLLDWSRLQTGRIKIDPVRLNVKTMVSNAIAPLTGDAVRKNIDVKIDIPTDLNINADERLISQVVYNLTSNAIKFTPEGKEVLVSSSRFKEGMIEIVIRDEGLGIAEENQTKLFKIDQKFSLVGTTGEKGSGLGLTLVKEIIDKHGGQIWFYTQIGAGSEFHFTVTESKNVILLVEDNKEVRILYKNIIEQALPNFEVKFADNGYQAIGLYHDIIPSIIITDHNMQLMNGIQLVEAILKKESNRTIPVIIISEILNEDISKKYNKLGVDRIITKPVDNDKFIQMIRECLY